jgi:hypothetical protein
MLGDGDFVGCVLASDEETMEKRYALQSRGFDLDRVAYRVSEVLWVKPEEMWSLSLHILLPTKNEVNSQ